MKRDLVTFPSGGEWEDSGEGGMYAVLVVPEPEDWSANCIVDVYTTVQHNRPADARRSATTRMSPHDVCISNHLSRELQGEYDYRSISYPHDSAKVLRGKGMANEARWVERAVDPSEFSKSMLATAFLGSTSESLYSEDRGSYFEATRDDLTSLGVTLYELHRTAYGIDPLILTFLDT